MSRPAGPTRRTFCALVAAAGLPAQAQNAAYPNRPINLLVPYPPGGGTDAVARILLEPLRRELGQPLYVENHGGAGGSIGTARAAQAQADGHTVLLTLSSHTINPAVYKRLPYDAARDFAGVARVASLPQVLVANPALRITDLRALMAKTRSEPGRLAYAAGNGSPSHIAGELFKRRAGVDILHVPYRGAAPAINDVIAGQVDLMWGSLSAVAPLIAQGRLVPLAVSTRRRSRLLPAVPTVEEHGVAGVDVDAWYAAFVPARCSREVVDRLWRAFERVLALPEVVSQFLAQGVEPAAAGPEALNALVRNELAAWARLVEEAHIKTE